MTRRLVTLFAVVLVALCVPLAGQQESIDELRAKAEQGDSISQFELGLAYETGRGVPEDGIEAERWYRLAAEQGLALAQHSLGVMYANGASRFGHAEGVRWFWLAAEQGLADAQYNLGLMFADGRGVPQDDAEAVRLFRLAAGQGHARSQYNLGLMYADGRGVPQDDVTAHLWFDLAASQSTGEDQNQAVQNRDIIVERLNSNQRAEAQRLAREWNEEHPR